MTLPVHNDEEHCGAGAHRGRGQISHEGGHPGLQIGGSGRREVRLLVDRAEEVVTGLAAVVRIRNRRDGTLRPPGQPAGILVRVILTALGALGGGSQLPAGGDRERGALIGALGDGKLLQGPVILPQQQMAFDAEVLRRSR